MAKTLLEKYDRHWIKKKRLPEGKSYNLLVVLHNLQLEIMAETWE